MPTWDEIARAQKLVRWRANPEKIRVSIRNCSGSWQVTITCRATGDFVTSKSLTPEKAVMSALKKADRKAFEGMDLGMGWAYEHPWK